MGSFWGDFGVVWELFGALLGLFCGHFGVILGSFCGRFGVIWGSFWGHFGIFGGSFGGSFFPFSHSVEFEWISGFNIYSPLLRVGVCVHDAVEWRQVDLDARLPRAKLVYIYGKRARWCLPFFTPPIPPILMMVLPILMMVFLGDVISV